MTDHKTLDDFADAHEARLTRLEPADVYDPAIVGVADINGSWHVVYDQARVIHQTVQAESCEYDEAWEWHGYNTFNQPVAPTMPVFLVWRA